MKPLSVIYAGAWILLSQAGVARAGTGCVAGGQMDWYTDEVGETPCTTYERLRQQCDPTYQLGKLKTAAPGDSCGGASSACCCNSVAWNLAMLCFDCQTNNLTYGSGSQDAAPGVWGVYQGGCSPVIQNGLPQPVQVNTCKSKLDLRSWLYPVRWGDGSWFYATFQQQVTVGSDFKTTNLTNCPAILAAASSTSKIATATGVIAPSSSASPKDNSSVPIGAIVGASVGGAALIIAILVGVCMWKRRKRNSAPLSPIDERMTYAYPPSYAPTISSHYVAPSASATQEQNRGSYTPFVPAFTPSHRPANSFGSNAAMSDPGFAGVGAGMAVQNRTSQEEERLDVVSQRVEPSYKERRNQGGVRRHEESFSSQGHGAGPSMDSADRHVDAGVSLLGRSNSGRLPPSYPGIGR